jgi:hypothetical protein
MQKRGLAIQVVILAALGMAIFVILFAIVANQLGGATAQLSSCQASCEGSYSTSGQFTNGVTSATADVCDPQFETAIEGLAQKGQPRGRAVEDIVRCTTCCARV